MSHFMVYPNQRHGSEYELRVLNIAEVETLGDLNKQMGSVTHEEVGIKILTDHNYHVPSTV